MTVIGQYLEYANTSIVAVDGNIFDNEPESMADTDFYGSFQDNGDYCVYEPHTAPSVVHTLRQSESGTYGLECEWFVVNNPAVETAYTLDELITNLWNSL